MPLIMAVAREAAAVMGPEMDMGWVNPGGDRMGWVESSI